MSATALREETLPFGWGKGRRDRFAQVIQDLGPDASYQSFLERVKPLGYKPYCEVHFYNLKKGFFGSRSQRKAVTSTSEVTCPKPPEVSSPPMGEALTVISEVMEVAQKVGGIPALRKVLDGLECVIVSRKD
jgi:hypothetical protein